MNYYRDGAHPTSGQVGKPLQLREIARSLMRLLALIVLIVYLPAMIGLAVIVMFTSPGPIFIKKAYRRGNGTDEVVYLYEFRVECWRTWQRTPAGKFMHHLDLHRLPRLINVLLGQVNPGERIKALQGC